MRPRSADWLGILVYEDDWSRSTLVAWSPEKSKPRGAPFSGALLAVGHNENFLGHRARCFANAVSSTKGGVWTDGGVASGRNDTVKAVNQLAQCEVVASWL